MDRWRRIAATLANRIVRHLRARHDVTNVQRPRASSRMEAPANPAITRRGANRQDCSSAQTIRRRAVGRIWLVLPFLVLAAPAAEGAPAPKPLRFSCAEALEDGTLIESSQAASLIAIAAGLRWKGDDPFGPPADCHRVVRLFCGPDLDRDGDAEAIVEVTWRFADDCASSDEQSGNFVPVTKTFLASRHGAVWRGVAPLAITTEDGTRNAFFVRRRGGETAIRVEWKSAATDSGCAIGRYEVFTLRAGALRRVESGDDSSTCVPCGCK
jgi:hypothetical protein